jgi:hypothetical protein
MNIRIAGPEKFRLQTFSQFANAVGPTVFRTGGRHPPFAFQSS